MCGIIGYVGKNQAAEKIVQGLKVLEYRGYDSVGICTGGDELCVVKTKGRVNALEKQLEGEELPPSTVAIGHTRWATHGSPSDKNAHPHRVGRVVLVHNGIIENYKELKRELLEKGYVLKSETDTEVGCGVIDLCISQAKDTRKGIKQAMQIIRGSYAFAIMVEGEGNKIYAVRKGSPLVVGKGDDGLYLASDITALLPFTRVYYDLREGELLTLGDGIEGDGEDIAWQKTALTVESAQKGGYEHFMLKEMWEQPSAIKKCLSPRIVNSLPCFAQEGIDREFLQGVGQVHIVACGSAMHAGLLTRSAFEKWAGVPTHAFVASEYRYTMPLANKDTLVVVVSQSGETADSIASLRYAKSRGLRTLAVVNKVESTIAKEADYRLYTHAGPEIAVATTKGYTTQICLLYLFAIGIGVEKGVLETEAARKLTECLFFDCPRAVEGVLSREERIREISEEIYERENIFYIGRGVDSALCQEAALKLKEISYIHCEAYPSGELKHGTISLIESGTPVIAISTEKHLFDKLDSNIRETKSRGAKTVLIGGKGETADIWFPLDTGAELSDAFGAVAAVQMLAYQAAVLRGCDVDKPRNLAKSVTVE